LDIFNASLELRNDQWILIEEALYERSALLHDISGINQDAGRTELASFCWDKHKEFEYLAKKVADVIDSLQAKLVEESV
jgi:hypothetical protein